MFIFKGYFPNVLLRGAHSAVAAEYHIMRHSTRWFRCADLTQRTKYQPLERPPPPLTGKGGYILFVLRSTITNSTTAEDPCNVQWHMDELQASFTTVPRECVRPCCLLRLDRFWWIRAEECDVRSLWMRASEKYATP